jgi:hypothetical protein
LNLASISSVVLDPMFVYCVCNGFNLRMKIHNLFMLRRIVCLYYTTMPVVSIK